MLEGKYNFKESEQKWQKFWQKKGVYEFKKDSQKVWILIMWDWSGSSRLT